MCYRNEYRKRVSDMRSILAVIFVFFFLVLNLPVMGVLWIVGKRNKLKADLAELAIVNWAFRVVIFISGVKLVVKGLENVPENEAVLYVGNHRSFYDVICTYPLVKGRTGYIAKDGINKVPILGMVMKRLYCLFIFRDDMKQSLKVILTAIEYIKNGISIAIFPEGTRCHDADPCAMLPFKEGSFKIATKTGCKIIPMAITGAADILENHMPWIKKGTIPITYGAPIDPKALDKEQQKQIGEYVQGIVREMLKQENTGNCSKKGDDS